MTMEHRASMLRAPSGPAPTISQSSASAEVIEGLPGEPGFDGECVRPGVSEPEPAPAPAPTPSERDRERVLPAEVVREREE